MIGHGDFPAGLKEAFWAYERALMDDDVHAMDELFAPGSTTLRGDGGGLLVGHADISSFRRARGGAPARRIASVHVHTVTSDAALVVAVTAPSRGGHGLQTQLWRRKEGRWQVAAAHVSTPPTTFDPAVWRVVGDPLVSPTSDGPLAGLAVAVEDVIAVAGQRIGAGHPAHLAEAAVENLNAEVVDQVMRAGASVRGITRTVPFAGSATGVNAHYGTPVNAGNPASFPGSATATAVALGAANLGVLRDTAAGTLLSAVYQGLWGLRLSRGATSLRGVAEHAPELDSIGLLAASPSILKGACEALVPAPGRVPAPP